MTADELKKQIAAARSRYYRLVLLVGPAASGKTKTLVQTAQAAIRRSKRFEIQRQGLDLEMVTVVR